MSKNISKNFITIQGWMVQELDLNSNNLLVFALIYGFNQDEESEFTGSLNYICNWLNCSKPTASKALNDLVEKQLLIKRTKYINNITFNSYQINFSVVKKLYGGDKETLSGGSKETLPYIDNINNIDDNYYKPATRFFTIHDFEKLEIGQNQFTLLATKQTKKTIEQIIEFFNEFITNQKALNNLSWKSEADAKQHFINWCKKQPEKANQNIIINPFLASN
jgi:hypothetical protein